MKLKTAVKTAKRMGGYTHIAVNKNLKIYCYREVPYESSDYWASKVSCLYIGKYTGSIGWKDTLRAVNDS